MRHVWEPRGPLPAAVYWRRRGLVGASAMLVALALVWSGTALLAPAPRPVAPTDVAAPRPALPFTLPSTPVPTPDAALAPPGPGPDQAPVAAEQTPSEPPPAGPGPCPDEVLGVSAEIDPPEHRVGERPVLRLVVVNLGDRPCVRDLDGARQEIIVWSGDGAQRLWSSNDCVNRASADQRTLVPGLPVAFAVRWAGRTSEPGCPPDRTDVAPGTYRVLTRLDDVVSEPVSFLRTP